MAGRLIYLMGPSGAGKDAVLQGLHESMGSDSYLAPRLVTRPAMPGERRSVSVSPTEFAWLESSGRLAMAWRANGLAYGVPRQIDDMLAAGGDVLVNGSRAYLPEACRRYQTLLPVLLSVDGALLRQRLINRGRENTEQISARLARNARFASLRCPVGVNPVFVLDNSGAIGDAIAALQAYLGPVHTIQGAA
ncbi:MAG: phosphonate metabolism protein/1,5-bisphosphokinase (PRPP-forming) PhnN [Pusillimonas sp.]